MTFQWKTRPLGVTKASSSWAARVRSTCQTPLRLSILVLNGHLAILSRVLSMLGIWPEGDSQREKGMSGVYHRLLKLAASSVRLGTINR